MARKPSGTAEAAPLPPATRRLDSVAIAALRSFVAVVEANSFSAASRHLGTAVSTVSKHIDTLEHRLSTKLFARSTRRLNLTESGVALYEHCRVALDSVDNAVEQTFSATAVSGTVRVVAPPSFTHCILSAALPIFLAQHPQVSVDLKVTTATVDLLRDRVDVAIRMTPTSGTGGTLERIGKAPSALCASPGYLARHGTPRVPTDLAQHRCLAGVNSPYSERWPFRVGTEVIEVPIRSSFTSDTGEMLRHACLHDLGIAGFYLFHIQPELDAGRLVRVLQDYEVGDGQVFALMPSGRFMPRATAEFLRFIRGVCAAL